MYSIEMTLCTWKFDNFKEVKFEQFWNIPFILVTLELIKVGNSILFKEKQKANIFSILVTCLISNFDKSKDIKLVQL